MNKDYIISGEKIYVTDETGPRKIPNSKNAVQIIKLDNDLEFLKKQLEMKNTEYETQKNNTSKKGLAILLAENILYLLVIVKIYRDIFTMYPLGIRELIEITGPAQAIVFTGIIVGFPIATFVRFIKDKKKKALLEAEINDLTSLIKLKKQKKEELEKEDSLNFEKATQEKMHSLEAYNKEFKKRYLARIKMLRDLFKQRQFLTELLANGELENYLKERNYTEEETREVVEITKSFSMRPITTIDTQE